MGAWSIGALVLVAAWLLLAWESSRGATFEETYMIYLELGAIMFVFLVVSFVVALVS